MLTGRTAAGLLLLAASLADGARLKQRQVEMTIAAASSVRGTEPVAGAGAVAGTRAVAEAGGSSAIDPFASPRAGGERPTREAWRVRGCPRSGTVPQEESL